MEKLAIELPGHRRGDRRNHDADRCSSCETAARSGPSKGLVGVCLGDDSGWRKEIELDQTAAMRQLIDYVQSVIAAVKPELPSRKP